MLKCTINGVDLEVKPGTTIIQAMSENAQRIAHYCWHPGLSIAGVCRLCMVEVLESPSLFFNGMVGSKMPIVVAHGEGYAEFSDSNAVSNVLAAKLVSVRFVDNTGEVTEIYPYNPNGSPQGITGLTTQDGRFSIMMPHPERVIRAVQNSWHPDGSGEEGPWLRMFRNARKFIG